MENDQYFMIHVDFRPPPSENKVKYTIGLFPHLHNKTLQRIGYQKGYLFTMVVWTCSRIITSFHKLGCPQLQEAEWLGKGAKNRFA